MSASAVGQYAGQLLDCDPHLYQEPDLMAEIVGDVGAGFVIELLRQWVGTPADLAARERSPQEIWKEPGLAVVVVVLDDAMLGWVRHVQGDRRIAGDLGAFDYAAIARATGCGGWLVTELADALGEALGADRPFVLDVVTAPDRSWRDVRSALAAGEAAAVPPCR
jgi:hypothetical protein